MKSNIAKKKILLKKNDEVKYSLHADWPLCSLKACNAFMHDLTFWNELERCDWLCSKSESWIHIWLRYLLLIKYNKISYVEGKTQLVCIRPNNWLNEIVSLMINGCNVRTVVPLNQSLLLLLLL